MRSSEPPAILISMFDAHPPVPRRDEAVERPRPKRAKGGLALLLGGLLVGGASGIAGARAFTAQIVPVAASAPATGATSPSTDTAAIAAIKDVIRRANAAQVQAFARNDPTAMQATSTAGHYRDMVRVNQELATDGVTKIELVSIVFGAVSVDGPTATATTTETWRSTYAAGTSSQSVDRNDYDLVLENDRWKISANTQPDNAGATAPAQPPTPASTAVQSTSRNWSGYAVTGGTFTSVTGTWVVAKPDPTVPGVDATWVGIGGVNTTDLVQAGTEATVNADGTVTYDAWTETLPQPVNAVTLAVGGGDTVSVSITEQSAGSWRIELKNVTTGKTYATTIRYSSSKSSAEWIQEAPSVGRGLAPLDRFGTVAFSGAVTVLDGQTQTLRGAHANAVTMTDGAGRALAVPSAIGGDGASFSVTRTSTPATNPGSGRVPGRRRG